MKKGIWRVWGVGLAAVVLAAALLSCQTAKPNTAGNSIQTEQAGLAPNGDKAHATIDFTLVFANTASNQDVEGGDGQRGQPAEAVERGREEACPPP